MEHRKLGGMRAVGDRERAAAGGLDAALRHVEQREARKRTPVTEVSMRAALAITLTLVTPLTVAGVPAPEQAEMITNSALSGSLIISRV